LFSAASWAAVSPASCAAVSFDLNDPALALDIDRPEDYQIALAKFGPKERSDSK